MMISFSWAVALILVAVQSGVLRCQAKKVISARIDYMEYTIEQYQLGLISFSNTGGDESKVSVDLTQNRLDLGSTTTTDASQQEEDKRHVGPFNRTPLLTKLDGKQSRLDADDDELSVHYEFNKTMGAYVIFHKEKDFSSNETVDDLPSSNLMSNNFDTSSSLPNTSSPSASSSSGSHTYCPPPYNPSKVDYVSESIVEVNGFIFKCNDGLYTKYCNIPTFDEVLLLQIKAEAEEVTNLWLNAWSIIGECERAGRPTMHPSSASDVTTTTLIETPTFEPSASPSWSPTTSPSWSPTVLPTMTTPTAPPVTANPSNSPTITPSYSPSTWSPTDYINPIDDKCSKSEARLRIELFTNEFPRNTSWILKKRREKSSGIGALVSRSKQYTTVGYHDIREVCLDVGTYEFVLRDLFAVGGSGYYKISAMTDDDAWQLLVAGAQFVTKEARHAFEVQKDGQVELVCDRPQRKIRIELVTDNFGEDTSWKLKQNGVTLAKNERVYGRKEFDHRDLCLDEGTMYEFSVYDSYGDGICCQFGQGHYKIISYNDQLEGADSGGVVILHGGMFFEPNITHQINTTTPLLSERDSKWLEAHNVRRTKYHAEFNSEYVPLQWSDGLKAEGKDT
jgi:hypothetical protein